MLFIRSLILFLISAFLVDAKRSLTATSLVTCMDGSQISPSYFNVTFNPDDRSLTYSLDLTTEINANIIAKVTVYAYGFAIIQKDVNLCSLGWKQFCPVYPGNMQVESVEYISSTYVDQIPNIAYTVPDIDAVVRVLVVDAKTNEQYSCLQASFSNGKTVGQVGVKWASAVIAGLGLLIAASMSTFGNSNAALHISANAVSLFLYFQSVVIVNMQAVERVPPIAAAWSENLAWSMGLIEVKFMQKIFRWYVQSTGGNPTLYFMGTTQQILVQRAYNVLLEIHTRAKQLPFYESMATSPLADAVSTLPAVVNKVRGLDFSLTSNANLIILRGIKRVGYESYIEPTSIVVTGFTFFIIFGYVLIALIVLINQFITLLIRFKKINPNFASHFRKNFANVLKGSVLRYVYIGFTQLVILSLWEFTQNDSPAVIILAILFLLLSLGMIGYGLWRTITFGRISVRDFKNPAALLYGDQSILDKYGFCYTMFHAEKYWFGVVLIGYTLVKGIFIGLCQNSGKTSTIVIFILDLAYTIYLFLQAPFLNKPTNVVNYCMSIVNTLNSFFFIFFSEIFGQPAQVASIMGWIFFILNAAFSLILLIMIIVLITLSLISKNPDARFAPAKDDRTSFQRKASIRKKDGSKESTVQSNELSALGAAAQDHQNDWEYQMYKLNDLSRDEDQNPLSPSMVGLAAKAQENSGIEDNSTSFDSLANEKEARQQQQQYQEKHQVDDHEDEVEESFGTKLKKLTRGISTKSKRQSSAQLNQTRLSDTIDDEDLHFNATQEKEESKDMLNTNPVSIPRDNSKTPINQHYRNPSNSAFSAYSTNPTDEPTNHRGFV